MLNNLIKSIFEKNNPIPTFNNIYPTNKKKLEFLKPSFSKSIVVFRSDFLSPFRKNNHTSPKIISATETLHWNIILIRCIYPQNETNKKKPAT
jgi:hypothetical protein